MSRVDSLDPEVEVDQFAWSDSSVATEAVGGSFAVEELLDVDSPSQAGGEALSVQKFLLRPGILKAVEVASEGGDVVDSDTDPGTSVRGVIIAYHSNLRSHHLVMVV